MRVVPATAITFLVYEKSSQFLFQLRAEDTSTAQVHILLLLLLSLLLFTINSLSIMLLFLSISSQEQPSSMQDPARQSGKEKEPDE